MEQNQTVEKYSRKIRRLRIISSVCFAPLLGLVALLVFSLVAFFVSDGTHRSDGVYEEDLTLYWLLVALFFLLGCGLMWFLHKTYQRLYRTHIVFAVLALIGLVFGGLVTATGYQGMNEIKEQREAFEARDEDGPPPDFTGLGTLIMVMMMALGGSVAVVSALVASSAFLSIYARRVEVRRLPMSAWAGGVAHAPPPPPIFNQS